LDLKEIGYEDVDCIHLAQDEVQWRAAFVTGKNFGYHVRRCFLSN
jgi:hypothetical protein